MKIPPPVLRPDPERDERNLRAIKRRLLHRRLMAWALVAFLAALALRALLHR